MDQSAGDRSRRRSDRNQATPYSRPDHKTRRSFLGKVSNSFKELLTPSWLAALLPNSDTDQRNANASGGNAGLSTPGAGNPAGSSSMPANFNANQMSHMQAPRISQAQPISQTPPVSQADFQTRKDAVRYSSENSADVVRPQVIQQMPTKESPYHETFIHQPPQSGSKLRHSVSPHERHFRDTVESSRNPPPTLNSTSQEPGANNVSKRPRLILDESSLNDSKLDRSSFDVSSFARSFNGSTNASILSNSSLNNSSFYPGKTVFGGKNSRRSFNLTVSSPYKRIDYKKAAVKSKPSVSSKAAKIILKALDSTGFHSSPNKASSKIDAFNPAVFLHRKIKPVQPSKAPQDLLSNAPPKTSVQFSSQAKVLPTLFTPVNIPKSTKEDVSYSNVQVKPLNSIGSGNAATVAGAGGKLRRDRAQAHYSSAKMDEIAVETPNLPTNFILPVSSSAKFEFGIKQSPSEKSLHADSQQKDTGHEFTFCSPKAASPVPDPSLSPTITSFTFRQPSSASDEDSQIRLFPDKPKVFTLDNSNKRPVSSSQNPNLPTTHQGSQGGKWKCDTCLIQNDSNKDTCAACQTKKPSTSSLNSGSSVAQFGKPAGDKWKCSTCLIQNDADKDSCVACQTKNPSNTSKSSSPSTFQFGRPAGTNLPPVRFGQPEGTNLPPVRFGNPEGTNLPPVRFGKPEGTNLPPARFGNPEGTNLPPARFGKPECTNLPPARFGKPEGTSSPSVQLGKIAEKSIEAGGKWKCDTCLIQNDSDKEACAACQTKKPSNTPPNSSVAQFGKTAGSKWKCDTCLIQNDADKDVCVACQTKKPSSSSQSSNSSQVQLEKPTGGWKCEMCLIKNDADKDVCVACQSKKPPSKSESQDQVDITGTGTAGWASASSPTSKLTGSWPSSILASNGWKCNICMVTNPDNVSLCMSCNACRPGTQSSLGDIEKGKQLPLFGVQFGNSSVTAKPFTDAAPIKFPTSDFKFGSASTDKSKTIGNLTTSESNLKSSELNKPSPAMFGQSVKFGSFDSKQEKPAGNSSISQLTTILTQDSSSQLQKTLASSGSSEQKATDSSGINDSAEPEQKKSVSVKFAAISAPSAATTSTLTPSSQQNTNPLSVSTNAQQNKPLFQFGSSSKENSAQPAPTQFGLDLFKSTKPVESSDASVTQSDAKKSGTTLGSSGPPVFQFGSKKPDTQSSQPTATAVPNFNFGSQSSNSSTGENAKPLFTFGTQAGDAASTSTNKLPFAATSDPKGTSTNDSSKPVFQFGSQPLASGTAEQKKTTATPFAIPSGFNAEQNQPKAAFQFVAAPPAFKPNDAAGSTFQPNEPSKTLFQFGEKTGQTGALFQFSSTQQSSTDKSSSAGGSVFGSSSNAFGNAASSTNPFNSGTPSSNVFGAQTTPANIFGKFGSGSAGSQPGQNAFAPTETPVFGMSQPKPSPSVGFQFGATSNTAPSFNFGSSNASAPNSTLFQFGQQAASSTPVIQFGTSQAANTTSVFPSQANPSASVFKSDSDSNSSSFSIGLANPQQRTIKRATRRIKK